MTSIRTAASGDDDGISAFLFHLAVGGVISTAQLQWAQEALRVWTPPARAGTAARGIEEQHPLLQRPSACAVAEGAPACGIPEDTANARHNNQLSAATPLPAKRCRLNSDQSTQEAGIVSPAASPRGSDAEGPMRLLPDALLDHLMTLLATEPGASSIRRTCSWLRSAFDRSTTRLMINPPRGPPLHHNALALLLTRNPFVRSLAVDPDAAESTQTLLYCAGELLQRLEQLSLRHWTDCHTHFLSYCTSLTHLDLHSFNPKVFHLPALSELPQLQRLDLAGCYRVDNLDFLSSCVRLQHLNLQDCELVTDIGPLASCTRLQHLELKFCRKLQNIQALASCVELHHLSLSCCELLEDIRPLASCVQLQHVDLSSTPVTDLGPLAACSRLQLLDLSECSLVQHLAPLSACPALQTLSLRDAGVQQLEPLAACPALQHLSISDCRVAGLGPLAACTGLLSVTCGGRHVTDLSALAACSRLQDLSLHSVEQLVDLGPLAACSSLQFLRRYRCNGFEDLGPLAACVELRCLSLSMCYGVEQLGPIGACVKLTELDLSYCVNVEDLGPLAACVELQELSIQSCSGVEDLRPLSSCVKLQRLDLQGCEGAKELGPLAQCRGLRVLLVSSACVAAEATAPLTAQLRGLTILWR